MITILKVQGVPVGQYTAKFDAIEETNHPEYGRGLIWKFLIYGGPHDGQTAQRVTPPQPTFKNACGKMLKAVTGSLPAAGHEVDLEQFIGAKFSILVEDAPSGGTRIATVIPLRDENG